MQRVDSLEKTLLLVGGWWWLRVEGEGDDRGWDGWMASLTHWTWVWVNSRSWWWTGRPGMLRFMGSQSRTRLSKWTELNWLTGFMICSFLCCSLLFLFLSLNFISWPIIKFADFLFLPAHAYAWTPLLNFIKIYVIFLFNSRIIT